MKNLRQLLLISAALAVAPIGSLQAASLLIVFDPLTLFGSPGQSVAVSGTVKNLEAVTVDLNSCAVNLPGQFTTDNCGIFFDFTFGAPLSLNAGDSATFDLFTFSANVPYTGAYGIQSPGATFTILGGLEIASFYDASVLNNLVEAPFDVQVTPEPGTFALFALAVALAIGLKRRAARQGGLASCR